STIQQQDDTYISYTLKNGGAAFDLVSDTVTYVGRKGTDGTLKILEVVKHTAENCPAEIQGAVGKICMLANSDNPNDHDKALTVKKAAANDTYYFWTAAGCFKFTLPEIVVGS
ncbi:MAG: hypothetical protein RSF77_03510, partial [Oscillospiraceae bacterium]